MSVPKCTSWLGHKFEARFDERMTGKATITNVTISDHLRILGGMKDRTYIHDICVRCGHVIERSPEASQ